jgi:hypothetical protein
MRACIGGRILIENLSTPLRRASGRGFVKIRAPKNRVAQLRQLLQRNDVARRHGGTAEVEVRERARKRRAGGRSGSGRDPADWRRRAF